MERQDLRPPPRCPLIPTPQGRKDGCQVPLTENEKIELGQAKRRVGQLTDQIRNLESAAKKAPDRAAHDRTISVLRRELAAARTRVRELELKSVT